MKIMVLDIVSRKKFRNVKFEEFKSRRSGFLSPPRGWLIFVSDLNRQAKLLQKACKILTLHEIYMKPSLESTLH